MGHYTVGLLHFYVRDFLLLFLIEGDREVFHLTTLWTVKILVCDRSVKCETGASWEWYSIGKPKYSERTLSQSHVFYHKSYVDWREVAPGTPLWEADDYPPDPWHGRCCSKNDSAGRALLVSSLVSLGEESNRGPSGGEKKKTNVLTTTPRSSEIRLINAARLGASVVALWTAIF